MHETKIPVQELWLKWEGDLCARGVYGRDSMAYICTVVTLKIKGTAHCPYNVYTVVTISHGIYNFPGSGSYTTARAVIPQLGSYTTGRYKVFVYIVQATYTIALSWFI